MKTISKSKDSAAQQVERRQGTRQQVDKMVTERTEMLALYWRLAGLDPFADPGHREPLQKLLQQFCQILVDYIAAGHFGLYERLVNGTERRRSVAEMAEQLYPRIAGTTQLALDFNERYDCGEHCQIPESFKTDLSKLGEELAMRIELEDKLIAHLMA